MPPETTEAQMLREVIKIKDELLAALQAGMDSVRASIIALSAEHKDALLQQERRNATFAERRRVDDIADIVSKRGNEIEILHYERRQSDEEIAKLRTSVTKLREYGTALETRVLNDPADRHWVTAARERHHQHSETILHVMRNIYGYLAGLAIILVLAVLGLAHFAPQIFEWH